MTTPAQPLQSQPDPMVAAFSARASQSSPAAAPQATGGQDPMVAAFQQRQSHPESQSDLKASGLTDVLGRPANVPPQAAQPQEPSISAIPRGPMNVPFARVLMDAVDKLREAQNFTQEGKQEHPVQAKIGDVANQIEGFLFGGSGHGENIGTGEYGMATNPVLTAVAAAPGAAEAAGSAESLVKQGISSLKSGGQAAEEGPGLVKQVMKGKEIAQEPAKAALRSAAETTGSEATPNIRAMMDKPIAQSAKTERAAYDTLNKAAGTDLKDLYEYRSKLQDAIENPANIDREDLLQEKLSDTESRIAHAEATATRNLVNAPQKLEEAKGLTQQRYAQEELKKRLFNNEGVVSGNAAVRGSEESINVDAAIKEVEKLDKPSRYAPEGSPTRLQQALGEDGAKALKQQLYDAQKAGETALTRQKIAKWLTGIASVGAGTEIAKHAISAFSSVQKNE